MTGGFRGSPPVPPLSLTLTTGLNRSQERAVEMVKLRLKEDDGKEGQYKLIETSYTTGELLLHF